MHDVEVFMDIRYIAFGVVKNECEIWPQTKGLKNESKAIKNKCFTTDLITQELLNHVPTP